MGHQQRPDVKMKSVCLATFLGAKNEVSVRGPCAIARQLLPAGEERLRVQGVPALESRGDLVNVDAKEVR